MQHIHVEKFYYSFLNGAKEVTQNTKLLNQINVFPVADGDTGTNLSSLMNHIIHHSELKEDLNTTLDAIASSAIHGARGNSGMIFAQYILGFCKGLSDYKDMTKEALIHASKIATDLAYQAVSHPVEGTILTSMKTFHISLKESSEASIIQLLEQSHQAVQKSVLNSKHQLKVLEKAKVVDSGAKGFACFIKGFIDGLKGHFTHVDDQELISEIPHDHHEIITYRYCTEALITRKTSCDYKALLDDFGDSIVTVNGDYKSRIHIHTDHPDKVFEKLSGTGLIVEQKVEDMVQQNNILQNRKYSTVIVSDSIADIPKKFVDDQQIYIIPLSILIDEETYLDKLTINNKRVLQISQKTQASSSQPTLKQIENALNYLNSHYENIIILSVSKELSGTFNVFKQAMDRIQSQKITLIDSKQNSVAQGLLLMMAGKKLSEGKEHHEITQYLKESIKASKILVHVKTLKPMIDSGRLSVRVGKLLSKVRLRPIITLKEGQGHIEKIAFGNQNSMEKLLKHVANIHKKNPITHYAITYIDSYIDALDFAERIEKIIGQPAEYIVESSSIIAISAGSGALAIGYLTERGQV